MSGYDDFRRLNDETNRRNEERNRQQAAERQRQLERDQDRQTSERRHRERLAAQQNHGFSEVSVKSGALKKSVVLVVGAGLAFLGISHFLQESPNIPSGELRVASEAQSPPAVAEEPQNARTGVAKSSSPPEAPPEAAADRADLSETAKISALTSGGSQSYEASDGLHVITVSDPISLGERSCRTIVDTASATATADTQTWCSSGSADWKRAS